MDAALKSCCGGGWLKCASVLRDSGAAAEVLGPDMATVEEVDVHWDIGGFQLPVSSPLVGSRRGALVVLSITRSSASYPVDGGDLWVCGSWGGEVAWSIVVA